MLPDLPSLKRDLQYLFDRYLRVSVRARMGLLADIPQHMIHEGDRLRVIRADGTVEDSNMKEASAEMTIQPDEVPTITVAERVARIDQVAGKMAQQMSTQLFGSLNESLEKAGQVVNGKGQPFSVETIFAALEKVQIDFDKEGNPKNLSFVIGTDLVPKMKEIVEQEKRDPEIKRRHDEIMMKKWIEWRDREAARKLVG